MTTNIDKIREHVERVREEHRQHIINFAVIVCGKCDAPADGYILWPCPTLRLAEKMLKLAEALDFATRHVNRAGLNAWQEDAERILAEVAE